MAENPLTYLGAWNAFYTITGTSASALIGLMFVVITLVTSTARFRRSHDATAAYTTPTVVHFAGALLVSAVLSAPWHSQPILRAVLWFVCLWGVLYVLRVVFRIRRLSAYVADMEDWIWHAVLPLASYSAIIAGAAFLPTLPNQSLFAIAGAVLTMLFIGIHNAWDIVTYVAIDNPEQE